MEVWKKRRLDQLSTYYGVTYVWTDIFPILNKFFIISMKNVMHDCSFGLAIYIDQMLWSDLKIAYFLYYLIEAQIQINLKWNVSVCVWLKFNRERANINMADGHGDGCYFIGWYFTVHFAFFWTTQATKMSKKNANSKKIHKSSFLIKEKWAHLLYEVFEIIEKYIWVQYMSQFKICYKNFRCRAKRPKGDSIVCSQCNFYSNVL